jgi:hypothetical protein
VRILFICPSLELGRDGVGDYTRRLANELERQGHLCVCIAINDQKMASGGEASVQAVAELLHGPERKDVRLESSRSLSQRIEFTRQILKQFRPDWVSLQYVPWGFAPRGLHFGLASSMRSLAVDFKLHVMCHELWLQGRLFPMKHRILGALQKVFIRRLFSISRPQSVHTHLEYYREMLNGIGVKAGLLPLHGNIPVTSSAEGGRIWLQGRIEKGGDSDCYAGFFGDLLPTVDFGELEIFIEEIERSGKSLHLLTAGRLSSRGSRIWQRIRERVGRRVLCRTIGYLDAHEVSNYLAGLDYGVTTYPYELAGKSGAVAAMLEHGIRVRIAGRMQGDRSSRTGQMFILPDKGSSVAQSAAFLVNAFAPQRSKE